ncbi:MAG: hypothetical protein S4CHLAM102_11600 [Chlamydiia bacterium]|nr:hypothetical protein [Chlamydiia bacterium]
MSQPARLSEILKTADAAQWQEGPITAESGGAGADGEETVKSAIERAQQVTRQMFPNTSPVAVKPFGEASTDYIVAMRKHGQFILSNAINKGEFDNLEPVAAAALYSKLFAQIQEKIPSNLQEKTKGKEATKHYSVLMLALSNMAETSIPGLKNLTVGCLIASEFSDSMIKQVYELIGTMEYHSFSEVFHLGFSSIRQSIVEMCPFVLESTGKMDTKDVERELKGKLFLDKSGADKVSQYKEFISIVRKLSIDQLMFSFESILNVVHSERWQATNEAQLKRLGDYQRTLYAFARYIHVVAPSQLAPYVTLIELLSKHDPKLSGKVALELLDDIVDTKWPEEMPELVSRNLCACLHSMRRLYPNSSIAGIMEFDALLYREHQPEEMFGQVERLDKILIRLRDSQADETRKALKAFGEIYRRSGYPIAGLIHLVLDGYEGVERYIDSEPESRMNGNRREVMVEMTVVCGVSFVAAILGSHKVPSENHWVHSGELRHRMASWVKGICMDGWSSSFSQLAHRFSSHCHRLGGEVCGIHTEEVRLVATNWCVVVRDTTRCAELLSEGDFISPLAMRNLTLAGRHAQENDLYMLSIYLYLYDRGYSEFEYGISLSVYTILSTVFSEYHNQLGQVDHPAQLLGKMIDLIHTSSQETVVEVMKGKTGDATLSFWKNMGLLYYAFSLCGRMDNWKTRLTRPGQHFLWAILDQYSGTKEEKIRILDYLSQIFFRKNLNNQNASPLCVTDFEAILNYRRSLGERSVGLLKVFSSLALWKRRFGGVKSQDESRHWLNLQALQSKLEKDKKSLLTIEELEEQLEGKKSPEPTERSSPPGAAGGRKKHRRKKKSTPEPKVQEVAAAAAAATPVFKDEESVLIERFSQSFGPRGKEEPVQSVLQDPIEASPIGLRRLKVVPLGQYTQSQQACRKLAGDLELSRERRGALREKYQQLQGRTQMLETEVAETRQALERAEKQRESHRERDQKARMRANEAEAHLARAKKKIEELEARPPIEHRTVLVRSCEDDEAAMLYCPLSGQLPKHPVQLASREDAEKLRINPEGAHLLLFEKSALPEGVEFIEASEERQALVQLTRMKTEGVAGDLSFAKSALQGMEQMNLNMNLFPVARMIVRLRNVLGARMEIGVGIASRCQDLVGKTNTLLELVLKGCLEAKKVDVKGQMFAHQKVSMDRSHKVVSLAELLLSQLQALSDEKALKQEIAQMKADGFDRIDLRYLGDQFETPLNRLMESVESIDEEAALHDPETQMALIEQVREIYAMCGNVIGLAARLMQATSDEMQ